MGDCPDEREAKARRSADLLTVRRNALGQGASLWSCAIRIPLRTGATMLVNLRVIRHPEGHLTRPAITCSIEPPF